MSDKLVISKYYTNLYKLSRQLLANELKTSNKLVIISSNCISLIAGLTFSLLQNFSCSYKVIYCEDELSTNNDDCISVLFVIGPKPKDDEKMDKLNWYFSYEGDEQNILCYKEHQNRC